VEHCAAWIQDEALCFGYALSNDTAAVALARKGKRSEAKGQG